MRRAEDKLDASASQHLIADATRALREARNWKDDVTFLVHMKKRFSGSRTVRLLHGVPSPRVRSFGYGPVAQMVAKDAIYFFVSSEHERAERLLSALPEMTDSYQLSEWLETFSSTRFEKQLIKALVEQMDDPIYRNAHELPPGFVCSRIALIAAEIDRLAWFTGQKSMTLANAAPVWRPR